MKLAVTGTREGTPYTWHVLDTWVAQFGRPEYVVLGGDENRVKVSYGVTEVRFTSRGVDLQALEWARARGLWSNVHYAKWIEGKKAGPRRNRSMASVMSPSDHCVALPGPNSIGTWQCLQEMRARGVQISIFEG